ncbi:class I SAM-dependent methyltransferase [Tsukamurella tyrosinosolvens]|uniref:class I SAM-dependent methyltransferase n=1 Tax=Tsukamurella tyrosinosolvens TaxID=57704 RepID=UPI001AFC0334|nr:class I SAM-dependent methyltransferase [Tsukamurella tyrosinosolvens]QRY84746.1 class I SAM-dependent methyltransferase [Tsukamurella tyrosinosolvens]
MTVDLAPRSSHADDLRVPVPTGVRARVLGRAARALLARAAARSGVTVTRAGDPVPAEPNIVLHAPDAVHRRIGTSRLIGFGEAYVAGEWDSPDLVAALTALAERMPELVPQWLQSLRSLAATARPRTEIGTPDHVRDNVSHHYDLSNDLFATFLDETLTYSSALFSAAEMPDGEPGVTHAGPATDARWSALAEAQHAKIDRLLDAAGVGPGTRLLEIGTGWGELCLRAAARGAVVRSVTLSTEQRDLALDRIAAAGVADRVQVDLLDYRRIDGVYDAVVSVEMIEAVGAAHWNEYFGTLARLVAPHGRIAVQAITMPHDRMLATLRTYTWIQKYVFPGGMLPSTEAVADAARTAGLAVVTRHRFGEHYAETLRLWRERFLTDPESLPPPADSAAFRRLWEFYLAYSEAGFRSGYLDVQQIVFAPEATR